jgi:hypothetical protein
MLTEWVHAWNAREIVTFPVASASKLLTNAAPLASQPFTAVTA